jgi:hypothetical protein
LSESAILTYNTIFWLLYVEASLSMPVLASVAGDLSNGSRTLHKK